LCALSRRGDHGTVQPSPQPLIERADVNAHLLALMDIRAEVTRIRIMLEEDEDVGGETEEDS
jgi:hypothetical protein